MPLIPSYTVTQQIGEPNKFVITDTSTGSDSDIKTRLVYLLKATGNYLVQDGGTENFVEWPLADASITINLLNRDYALNISVAWVDEAPYIFDETFDETFN